MIGDGKRKQTASDQGQSSEIDSNLITGANYPQKNAESLRIDNNMKAITLPKNSKLLMSDKGLSLRKLAKQTGIGQSTISGYLSENKKAYDPVHLGTLSDFFNVSVDYLLFGKVAKIDFGTMTTKKLFSKIVRLTIEDIEDLNEEDK
jgi:transcriptional regulator with XRE-family HTH domain